ncbi:MAG: hypothetical protein KDI44_00205 [Thiothrix sp.]|nr:hypothetical protein [Thiothrix sp.]HPQ96732.1 hypothetical protein [Thiolinea sp.]
MADIADQIASAQAGTHPRLVGRVRSGWVVMGEHQFLPGYCLLLADPVVRTLNDLTPEQRSLFLWDLTLVGDAILACTPALRPNYEILGNVVQELHAHVFPRFADEAAGLAGKSAFFYDWEQAPRWSEAEHGTLRSQLQRELARLQHS